ncbi:MAG: hypothetical protein CMK06_10770 [Ponticaulis sp.]|nr:hypothetical protein [Ponticaulis sp.]|tara:strand:+ start:359 stop:745 length:387 start_codon:yes stop_codon:yes gene_type:complete
MSELAHILHDEHRIILNLLKDLRRVGPSSPEGHNTLMKARTLIVEHLRKEDEQLYPVLRESEITADIAQTFADEMAPLASRFLAFFERYDTSPDCPDFAPDLAAFWQPSSAGSHARNASSFPHTSNFV